MDNGGSGVAASSNSSSMSMMIPYLHFATGDYLFFKAWKPSSAGVLAAACVGLIILALFERWLAATRSIFAAQWRQRAFAKCAARDKSAIKIIKDASGSDASAPLTNTDKEIEEITRPVESRTRTIPSVPRRRLQPFVAAHDIPRGVLYALQMLVVYLLMLAVMTFQAAFFISIVLGLGVGEVIFGRLVQPDIH